jgi:hypothetical protein
MDQCGFSQSLSATPCQFDSNVCPVHKIMALAGSPLALLRLEVKVCISMALPQIFGVS